MQLIRLANTQVAVVSPKAAAMTAKFMFHALVGTAFKIVSS